MFATIQEYFTLSDARATAKIVPADARAAIGRQLALGRQRSEAADALWSNGHVAEGLRLAAEAFDATLEAVAPFERAVGSGHHPLVPPVSPPRDEAAKAPSDGEAPADDASAAGDASATDASAAGESSAADDAGAADDASATGDSASATGDANADTASASLDAGAESDGDHEPASAATESSVATELGVAATQIAEATPREASVGEPVWATMLRRRGVSESRLRAVLEADRAVRAKTLPLLDQDVSASEGELFQQLVTARRHVDQALSPASMTAGQLAWTRASRIGFAAFVACAVIVGLYLLLRPPTGVEATASGQYNAEFVPGNVVDGDEATEWLLPDRRPGWVDVRIMPGTHIDTLRIKNVHNRHYNDRGTHEYTIDVYSHGRKIRTVEGSWGSISPRPEWTEHELDLDDVDRIRVNVRSWHRLGGGIAEIDWN